MKVTALIHYGNSYAVPDGADVDHFDSLKDLRDWMRHAIHEFDRSLPCTDDSASAWIFFGHIDDATDMYPDAVATFGPRGGVCITPC